MSWACRLPKGRRAALRGEALPAGVRVGCSEGEVEGDREAPELRDTVALADAVLAAERVRAEEGDLPGVRERVAVGEEEGEGLGEGVGVLAGGEGVKEV